MHLCLSSNSACSGISPCRACFEFLKQNVLVQAMVAVGGPFVERGAPWPPAFIQAYCDVWRNTMTALLPELKKTMMNPTLNAQPDPSAEPTVQGAFTPEEAKAASLVEPQDDPNALGYDIPPEKMQEYLEIMRAPKIELATNPTPPVEGKETVVEETVSEATPPVVGT